MTMWIHTLPGRDLDHLTIHRSCFSHSRFRLLSRRCATSGWALSYPEYIISGSMFSRMLMTWLESCTSRMPGMQDMEFIAWLSPAMAKWDWNMREVERPKAFNAPKRFSFLPMTHKVYCNVIRESTICACNTSTSLMFLCSVPTGNHNKARVPVTFLQCTKDYLQASSQPGSTFWGDMLDNFFSLFCPQCSHFGQRTDNCDDLLSKGGQTNWFSHLCSTEESHLWRQEKH